MSQPQNGRWRWYTCCSIHLTVIGVLSYGGFIVIANNGMAIHLVQLIMVSLPGICQFTFSFGSMLRNKDHNQQESSNLLHWTRCKKGRKRGCKSLSYGWRWFDTHATFPVSNYYHIPSHFVLKSCFHENWNVLGNDCAISLNRILLLLSLYR